MMECRSISFAVAIASAFTLRNRIQSDEESRHVTVSFISLLYSTSHPSFYMNGGFEWVQAVDELIFPSELLLTTSHLHDCYLHSPFTLSIRFQPCVDSIHMTTLSDVLIQLWSEGFSRELVSLIPSELLIKNSTIAKLFMIKLNN